MKLKLNEIQPVIDNDHKGIFEIIQSLNIFTWLDSTKALNLDYEYYYNHSGEKYLAPITLKFYYDNEPTYLSKLASIITNKFKDKWDKIYEAFIHSDYNPIENYSMEENENVGSEIVNDTDANQNVFGFNTDSENGVPQTINSAKTTTSGDYEKNKRKLTRSGNIGVTTSQQMIQSEIDLRQYNLYDQMMEDVDSVMCLSFREVR